MLKSSMRMKGAQKQGKSLRLFSFEVRKRNGCLSGSRTDAAVSLLAVMCNFLCMLKYLKLIIFKVHVDSSSLLACFSLCLDYGLSPGSIHLSPFVLEPDTPRAFLGADAGGAECGSGQLWLQCSLPPLVCVNE